MAGTQGERIVALEAANRALVREVRQLRGEQKDLAAAVSNLSTALAEHQLAIAPLLASNVQLARIIEEGNQAKGAVNLAKFLAGGGALGVVAAALLGIFHFFSKG